MREEKSVKERNSKQSDLFSGISCAGEWNCVGQKVLGGREVVEI